MRARLLASLLLAATIGSGRAFAFEPPPAEAAATPAQQDAAVHGQATFVLQGTPGFSSPYSGPNSLTPHQLKETADLTVYAGLRPWAGAELWINPEIDQGFGLSNTLGVAGFPSAEAYKVGSRSPYLRLQRLFLRQTIGLGGGTEPVEGAANQLAGARDHDRLVLTVGKLGVGDIFEQNAYAHDPRGDFLNWALVDAGSFDYAADAWGYTTGVALEYYRGPWTFRFGAFNLSRIPNGETLETGFGQYQLDAELEHRQSIGGHAGAVRLTLFRNRGRFGRYDDAVALAAATGGPVDLVPTRMRRSRMGASLDIEQAVSDSVGLFARAGFADGAIEPYDFTDIDRTAQIGAATDGKAWGRAADRIGIAELVNGISRAHQRYLDAGGLGVLVGDGRLPHPGPEYISEAYYDLVPHRGIALTLDYQFVANPGYNRDRGPVHVLALRLHGAF
jgi:high affinity Mn2+ porin